MNKSLDRRAHVLDHEPRNSAIKMIKRPTATRILEELIDTLIKIEFDLYTIQNRLEEKRIE